MPASRLYFVRRRATARDLLEARVTGAEPDEGLQCTVVGESLPVVADLGEHDGADDVGQATLGGTAHS